jgi:hypothetical protein
LLKKTTLWNAHCPTFAQFKAAIHGFFQNLVARHAQLATLVTDQFRFISAPEVGILKAYGYMMVEGISVRAISRLTGTSKTTILKLLEDTGQACARFQSVARRGLHCRRVQVDEL